MHKILIEGHPPPLSAMLAPALGESLTRWEELGSGFSGHGFDDRDKERFLPDPNLPPPPDTDEPSQTYTEWLKQKRAQVVQTGSERLRNIRASLFRWRLHMKEVEHESSTHATRKDSQTSDPSPSANSSESTINLDEEAPEPAPSKPKSWVWQWSRHK
jgi:hypothetical protein